MGKPGSQNLIAHLSFHYINFINQPYEFYLNIFRFDQILILNPQV